MIPVDDFNNGDVQNNNFLLVRDLKVGKKYTKVAYLSNVSIGIQRNDFGFATFYLKDYEGNLITAKLFNIADFMMSGVNATLMRKHPVELTFVVQEFNGISLIIDDKAGIHVWEGNFPYAEFLGKVNVDTSTIQTVGEQVIPDYKINAMMQSASFDSIAQGRAGGFLKVFDMALATIYGYNDVVGVNFRDLIFTFYNVMDLYFDVLTQRQKMNNFEDMFDDEILHNARVKFKDDDRKMPIINSLRALISNSKPIGFDDFVIKNAVETAMTSLNAAYQLNITPIGVRTNVGGVSLLKY